MSLQNIDRPDRSGNEVNKVGSLKEMPSVRLILQNKVRLLNEYNPSMAKPHLKKYYSCKHFLS